MRKTLALLAMSMLLWAMPAQGQPEVPTLLHPRQVYLERDPNTGAGSLIFLDLLTGDEQTVRIAGERFTVTPDGVMFYAPGENRVKVAMPDGRITNHPFIQPGPNTRRIDWVLDQDALHIAWTRTEGLPGTMTTVTQVANFDGSDVREVLVDGPHDGIRAMPVAFSHDQRSLYMDFQPDSVGDYTTFRQYAGLFAVDLDSGATQLLPGEPGCFCGAGLGSGWFLRLMLTSDSLSFDLAARQLDQGIDATVPSLRLADFTQGGDILISADGTRAVYALAQIRGFGTPGQIVQAVLVLVDLQALTQRVLGRDVDFLLHPVAWTEDNSAVILTSPSQPGTWKIDIEGGDLSQIASATYLGRIGAGS
ncbi:MAG: hypothetical protein IT320_12605 [Anaerolineae bacterium]|nr:hypothetical protein [Anaerolineae bacterium]